MILRIPLLPNPSVPLVKSLNFIRVDFVVVSEAAKAAKQAKENIKPAQIENRNFTRA